MTEHSNLPAVPEPPSRLSWSHRWQFTARHLFLWTGILACILAIERTENGNWQDAVNFVGTLGIAIGLGQQAIDIRRSLHRNYILSRQAKSTWEFVAAWRWGVAALIIAFWVLEYLGRNGIVSEPPTWLDSSFSLGFSSKDGILSVCIVVGLSASPWGIPTLRGRNLGGSWMDILGVTAALVVCLLIAFDQTLIHALTHSLCHSMEVEEPVRFAGQILQTTEPPGNLRSMVRFNAASVVCLGFVIAGTSLLACLTRTRIRAYASAMVGIALFICLAAAAAYVVWVHTAGLYSVSPVLAETKISMSWPSRLSAGSLTVLFVAAAAYRLNFLNAQEFDEPPLAWRRCPSPYWNESRLIVVFLLLPVAKSWFEMIRCF